MRQGVNIWGEVYDTRHFVSTGLGTRSRGFVWFFSFIAWYSQVKRKGQNVILLLDEPGLALMARRKPSSSDISSKRCRGSNGNTNQAIVGSAPHDRFGS
jgi:hypothetical protein